MARTILVILVMLALMIGSVRTTTSAQEQTKPDKSCPWYQTVEDFAKAVKSNDGDIEPIHIPEGLALLATTKVTEKVKALHVAAQEYIAGTKKLKISAQGDQTTPCWVVRRAIMAGKISEAVTPTERGVVITLLTRDTKLRDVLQAGACCQYCICPSRNGRCQKCC